MTLLRHATIRLRSGNLQLNKLKIQFIKNPLDFFGTASIRALGALSLFLLTLGLTSLMPVAEAGIFFHSFSMIMLTAPLALLGMNHLGIRLVAIANSNLQFPEIRGFVASSMTLVLVSSSTATATWIAVSRYFGVDIIHPDSAGIFVLLAVTVSIGLLLAFVLQGLSRPNISIFCQSILPCIFCIATVILLSTTMVTNHRQAMLAFACGSTLSILLALTVIFRRTGIGKFKVPAELRPNSSVFYLWIVSVGTAIINWGPLFMLGLAYSPESVAELNVAYRIAMILTLLQLTVAVIVSPKMAVMYDRGQLENLEKLMRKIVTILSFISIPIALIIYLNGQHILRLFSSEFSGFGIHCLTVFLVTQSINVLTGPSNQLLLMTKKEREMAHISTVSSVLTVLSTLVFLKLFGAIGAAYGMLFGSFSQNVTAAVFVYKLHGLHVYRF